MIISKTPFRMSFFGGGTDMPDFFRENGGAVLSTTFDKYCYVSVRRLPPFFTYATELAYSKIERVTDVENIEHPAVRNAMKLMNIDNIRLSYEADLPARSGLGTSSSFAVGMLNAFAEMNGQQTTKKELADKAIYLERTMCQEAGGWQDQIAAAYGGLNRIDFSANGYHVTPVDITKARKQQLNDNLLLYFTGFTRLSSEVQKANQVSSKSKHGRLVEMLHLVNEAQNILTDTQRDLDDFGRLLDCTWKLKKDTGTKISTEQIDVLYEKAMAAGALGGKLLGAGNGGFIVLYAAPDKQAAVKKALEGLLHIPFAFEQNGTQILYNAGKAAQNKCD